MGWEDRWEWGFARKSLSFYFLTEYFLRQSLERMHIMLFLSVPPIQGCRKMESHLTTHIDSVKMLSLICRSVNFLLVDGGFVIVAIPRINIKII